MISNGHGVRDPGRDRLDGRLEIVPDGRGPVGVTYVAVVKDYINVSQHRLGRQCPDRAERSRAFLGGRGPHVAEHDEFQSRVRAVPRRALERAHFSAVSLSSVPFRLKLVLVLDLAGRQTVKHHSVSVQDHLGFPAETYVLHRVAVRLCIKYCLISCRCARKKRTPQRQARAVQ